MSNRRKIYTGSSYLSQFLILIGIVILCATLFAFAGLYIANNLYGFNLDTLSEILSKATPTPEEIAALKLIQGTAAIGGFLVPALLAPRIFNENTQDYLKFYSPKLKYVGLAALLMLAILPFNSFLIEVSNNFAEAIGSSTLDEMQKNQDNTMKLLLNMQGFPDYLFNLFLVALIPAVGEELLFRGAAQSLFKRWFGSMHVAIIIQGVIFGIMHQQIQNIIPLAALGILLGYIVWYTGSIWTSVLMHFINNGLAVTAYYFMKDESVWEQMVNDNFPLYLSIISLILSAGIFYVIWKNRTIEKEITIEIE